MNFLQFTCSLILICTQTLVFGQYRTWVIQKQQNERGKVIKIVNRGVLQELKDSSIVVSPQYMSTTLSTDREIPINSIESLKFRKKNLPGKGLLIGAISGFALGGLMGLASGDDHCDSWCFLTFTAEEKAVLFGVPLMVVGGFTGSILGSFRINIPLDGSQAAYKNQKNGLKKYLKSKK